MLRTTGVERKPAGGTIPGLKITVPPIPRISALMTSGFYSSGFDCRNAAPVEGYLGRAANTYSLVTQTLNAVGRSVKLMAITVAERHRHICSSKPTEAEASRATYRPHALGTVLLPKLSRPRSRRTQAKPAVAIVQPICRIGRNIPYTCRRCLLTAALVSQLRGKPSTRLATPGSRFGM